ncbi:MAG: tRNA (adenosine(37)-N6)-dimethylallyltransferase MiaA, partial [Coxiellaceae bacterium]|nr:tRNA (adenosine(37)-N6)-dimethylallyltransferase MiaA [Coxiellaceae bacterium]
MRPIICLLGPTATGKTNLSIALAEQFDGEIISVDSALIYKGMDIGTAKPTPEERQGIVHHLIDIIEPEQAYSAANFCQDALRLCDEIQARGKTPILCGGTMMYFHALFTGLSDLPEADRETRAQITAQAEHDGWSAMHARLAKIDPDSAARIQPTDPQRLTRALEVYELTGHNLSFLCKQKSIRPLPYPTIK